MARHRTVLGNVYERRGHLRLWFYDGAGAKRWMETPLVPGQEVEAHGLLAEVLRRVKAGLDPTVESGELSFAAWGERWVRDRRDAGKGEHLNERAHLEHHLVPLLGSYRLRELTGRQLLEVVRKLSSRKSEATGETLSPATVRKVASTLRSSLKEATKRGLIAVNPCTWEREDLPEGGDRAIGEGFTDAEVQVLISDLRIPEDRRVLYGLEFLTGMRTGESAARRWHDWDPSRAPLGAMKVETAWSTRHQVEKDTKTGVRRVIPVHRALAALLERWRAGGWERFMGRPPTPEDLIVPRQDGEHRLTSTSWRAFQADLEVLGFTGQRHYETRATFIGLAEGGGADASHVALLTHPSPKSAKDLYRRTKLLWPALCRAVEAIKVEPPPSGAPPDSVTSSETIERAAA